MKLRVWTIITFAILCFAISILVPNLMDSGNVSSDFNVAFDKSDFRDDLEGTQTEMSLGLKDVEIFEEDQIPLGLLNYIEQTDVDINGLSSDEIQLLIKLSESLDFDYITNMTTDGLTANEKKEIENYIYNELGDDELNQAMLVLVKVIPLNSED